MSNLITLNTPTAPEYLQGFIDRWTQGRQNARQDEIQRGNLDVNRRNASVNEGQLQFQQGEAKDKGLRDESMGILKQVVQLKLANREADAKALVDQIKAQRPELVPHMGEIAAALVHTPGDDEARNTQQVFTNDSQSVLNSTQPPPLQTSPMSMGENGNLVGGVNPSQPEMAPPNPQAANRFNQRNFKSDLSPQAMQDVQAQQPGAGGYDPFLKRKAEAIPTAAQDLQSQTQIKTEGMREAGAMQRTKAEIASKEKIASGENAAAVAADTQELVNNPDVWFSWDQKKRGRYLQAGGRAPAKLDAAEQRREMAAMQSLQILDDVSGILDKWHAKGLDINGPMLGRYNEATRSLGGTPIPRNIPRELVPEYEGDIAKMQEWLGANKVGEVTAIVGGRANYQYLKELAPPVISQNNNFLRGSIDGMKQRMSESIDVLNRKRWGKSGPPAAAQGNSAAQNDGATHEYVKGKGLVVLGH